MKSLTRKILALLLVGALLLGPLAGCAFLGGGDPSYLPQGVQGPGEGGVEPLPVDISIPCDGRISISFVLDDALNPYTSTSRDNLAVAGLLYEGLYALGENFTAIPMLAEGVTTLDGRRYTVTLRQGVTFHNGEGLTVEDLIYSLNRARNSPPFSGRLSIVSGYERRLDAQGLALDYELDILLNRTHGNIPLLLTFPIIPQGSFGQSAPPGTGPYRFMDEGGPARLVGFPEHRYSAYLPVDPIYLTEIITMEQMTAHFNSGLLDIAALDLSATGDPRLDATRELRHFETSLMDFIGFNLQRPETRRVEVRQAISLAIDRAYLTENIMRGNAVPASLPFHPTLFYYNELPTEELEFDPLFARWVLAGEASLTGPIHTFPAEEENPTEPRDPEASPGEDTEEGGGPMPHLTLLVASGNTNRLETAAYIAASIAELGYQVTVDDRPFPEFMQMLEAGSFDLFYGQIRLQPDFDLTELLFGSLAFGGWGNLIDHRLHDDFLASSPSDRGLRAATLSQAMITEAPFAVIGFRHLTVATQRGVVIGMQPTQENIYHNVWEWIVNLSSNASP